MKGEHRHKRSQAVAPTGSPDAELLRLDAKRQALQAKYEAMEAEDAQLLAKLPKVARSFWLAGVTALCRWKHEMPLPPGDDATHVLLDVAIKHGRELDRKANAILKEAGHMKLRRQINAVLQAISRLEDRIDELPAKTVAGATVKIRLAAHYEREDGEYTSVRLVRDALATLEASGEGVS